MHPRRSTSDIEPEPRSLQTGPTHDDRAPARRDEHGESLLDFLHRLSRFGLGNDSTPLLRRVR